MPSRPPFPIFAMPARRRRLGLAVLGFSLVALYGCDTVSPDPEVIILNREVTTASDGSSIRFTFDADGTPTGQTVTIRCDCTVDLGSYLRTQGFEKADIVAASVRSATLVMLFPISERLDFLNSAVMSLEAAGVPSAEVASSSSLPNAREAALAPNTTRDVSDLVSASSFQPVLRINASELQAGAEYELGIAVTIRLELEGF